MPSPLLYDAVTLRHFAVAEELPLLQLLHDELPGPRWTQAVDHEIRRGAELGLDDCAAVQAFVWLGLSYEAPDLTDLIGIQQLRAALSKPGDLTGNVGEAETLWVAEKLGAAMVTDDAAAHEFALRRLGPERVFDTIDLLRAAVGRGLRNAQEASEIAARVSDAERHLRYVHPEYPEPSYFE